jgi:hypothetical protein
MHNLVDVAGDTHEEAPLPLFDRDEATDEE